MSNYTTDLTNRLRAADAWSPDEARDLLDEAATHIASFHAQASAFIESNAEVLQRLSSIHEIVRDSRSYVPQDVAAECILALEEAGFGKPGDPHGNTLHGMVMAACARLKVVHDPALTWQDLARLDMTSHYRRCATEEERQADIDALAAIHAEIDALKKTIGGAP